MSADRFPCTDPRTCWHIGTPMPTSIADQVEALTLRAIGHGRTAVEVAAIRRARIEFPGRWRELRIRERITRMSRRWPR